MIAIDADKLWKAITTNHDDYIELGELGELIYDGEMEAPTAQKTGRWKEIYAENDCRNGWIEFTCENCKCQHEVESGQYEWYYGDDIPWNYCPNCGARMVGDTDDEI